MQASFDILPPATVKAPSELARGYTAGLFLASDLNTPLATTTFRTTTAQEGSLRVSSGRADSWCSARPDTTLIVGAGSFLNAKDAAGVEWGHQQFTTALVGPNPDPTQPAIFTPDMGPGFTGFLMHVNVPEPTTIALSMVGVAALVVARSRK